MYFSDLRKWVLFVAALYALFEGSVYYKAWKMEHQFVSDLRESKVYEDTLIDSIYSDFLRITNFHPGDQTVSIKLVKFPYQLNWIEIVDPQTDATLNDAIGYANGMNDDEKVDVYLDLNEWKKLNYIQKKSVLYHELLHDCFNTEHSRDRCNLMYSHISDCQIKGGTSRMREESLDLQLNRIIHGNFNSNE